MGCFWSKNNKIVDVIGPNVTTQYFKPITEDDKNKKENQFFSDGTLSQIIKPISPEHENKKFSNDDDEDSMIEKPFKKSLKHVITVIPRQEDDHDDYSGTEIEHYENNLEDFDTDLVIKEPSQDEISEIIESQEIFSSHKMIDAFTKEVNEWKNLLNSLNENKQLESYAYSRKHTEFFKVVDLLSYLKKYEFKSDFEKAWLVFIWIADNIEYDKKTLENFEANQPETVLRTGKCVCGGYSRLFVELCQGLGLESQKIAGYSKAAGYTIGQKFMETDHAWAAVKLNGDKWYYVEPTWASGSSKSEIFTKKLNIYWFLTPPHIFIYQHYSPEFQLQSKKITLEEFEEMPLLKLDFHLYGLKCLSHTSSIITWSCIELIEFSAPDDLFLMGTLKLNNIEIEKAVLIQRDSKSSRYGIFALLPEKNITYELTLFAKKDNSDPNLLYDEVTTFMVNRTCDFNTNAELPEYSLKYDFDLKCLSHTSSIISTSKTPIFLDFSSPRETLIMADLFEENQDKIFNKKLENCLIVQRDARTYNYGILCRLPKMNKYFLLDIFAKHKENQGFYRNIGKFLLRNHGNEINLNMPKYTLGFEYGLVCVSHASSIIASRVNPLFVEFNAPKQTLLMGKLLTGQEFNEKITSSILIQRDTETFKYGMLVNLPDTNKTYKLAVFAKTDDQDKGLSFRNVGFFLVSRIANEIQYNLPDYSLEFKHGLRLLSHRSLLISTDKKVLFMEFGSPKDTLIMFDLKDDLLNIDKSVLVQRDAKTFKYGVFVLMPHEYTHYTMNLFAKNIMDSTKTYAHVVEFWLTRTDDKWNEQNDFPSYSLEYDYSLKCLSHFSQYIESKTNLIDLIFSAPKSTLILAELFNQNGTKIENFVFIQRSRDQSRFEIKVALPFKNSLYGLKLFAKHAINTKNTYDFLTEFKLITNQSGLKNGLVKNYANDQIKSYVYQPINYNLPRGQLHSFKVFVKDAIKVALCDQNNKWYFLEVNEEDSIWAVSVSFECLGELSLYVRNDPNSTTFKSICSYCVV